MRTRLPAVLCAAALLLGASICDANAEHVDAPPDESFNEYVPGAALLESKLLSPCCWDENGRQTLAVHRSPIANELRLEIRRRLKAGETPDAIQADLVRRYTTKILATPPDNPVSHLGTILSLGLVGAGGFAAVLVARWRRRTPDVKRPDEPAKARDEWDERLDAELRDPD